MRTRPAEVASFLKTSDIPEAMIWRSFSNDVPRMLFMNRARSSFPMISCRQPNRLRGGGIHEYIPAVTVFHVDEIRGALNQRFQHTPVLSERLPLSQQQAKRNPRSRGLLGCFNDMGTVRRPEALRNLNENITSSDPKAMT